MKKQMKKLCDMYNNKQKKYRAFYYKDDIFPINIDDLKNKSKYYELSIMDFIFNPKWKFAESLFGNKNCTERLYTTNNTMIIQSSWTYHKQNYAILKTVRQMISYILNNVEAG